jgi:hypothetical protein
MESVKIVLFCIASAIVYGILHDQVTARVCVEYFTIGHPPIFGTDSPTLLALGWGTIATWWAGLIVGLGLAAASRLGPWPKYRVSDLVRPTVKLLGMMAGCSLIAGVAGYISATMGWVWLVGWLQRAVPESAHSAFLADLWAHQAAYAVGFVGGIVLCRVVYLRRRLMAFQEFL